MKNEAAIAKLELLENTLKFVESELSRVDLGWDEKYDLVYSGLRDTRGGLQKTLDLINLTRGWLVAANRDSESV